MSDAFECVGGPLDGKRLSGRGGAFPWPHGWYYCMYADGTPITRNHDGEMVYRWDGNSELYLSQDHERWLFQ